MNKMTNIFVASGAACFGLFTIHHQTQNKKNICDTKYLHKTQDAQCAYNLTLWLVHESIVTVEKQ
jgi:hypothetical protein